MATRRTKSTIATGSQPRQLPGPACEECRKRKLRCDRQRPTCSTCAEAGVVCDINTNRLARGPKKGDLKALRNRVMALERRLSLETTASQVAEDWSLLGHDHTDAQPAHELSLSPLSTSPGAGFARHPSPCQSSPPSWNEESRVQVTPVSPASFDPYGFSTYRFPPATPQQPRCNLVDDLMRADLDQIYFDRVHPNVPIFNQSKYFARSRRHPMSGTVPGHMLCLQYAMWTLATALSSQFEELGKLLYKETRDMLEAFEANDQDTGSVPIEQVQAWLLLSFYELARCNHRRAWTTAGRTFRLVQLARLYEVDGPEYPPEGEDPVSTEERRRTFWIAYGLDRLICIRNRCPSTLSEESIYTRLPSHEIPFQSGHPIPSCFLSEAIAPSDRCLLPSLAEFAVLATVCGRALSHAMSSRAYSGAASMEFWARHKWVEAMLSRVIDGVTASNPMASAVTDPIVFFTLMMAHSTTIYTCEVLESLGMDSQYQPTMMECQNRAIHAASEVARHAKAHEHIGYFKAHTFLPWAISMAASRLIRQPSQMMDVLRPLTPPGSFQFEYQSKYNLHGSLSSCMDALRKMQSFNNIARDQLSLLEPQEFGMTGL